MYCKNCGAQLEPSALTCPRCGNPVNTPAPQPNYENPYQPPYQAPGQPYPTWQQQPLQPAQPGWNIFALLGFIMSFFHFPVVSLVFCIIGLVQCRKNNQKGKGFAIAGIVLWVLFYVLVAALVAVAIWLGAQYPGEFFEALDPYLYGFA